MTNREALAWLLVGLLLGIIVGLLIANRNAPPPPTKETTQAEWRRPMATPRAKAS